MRVFVVMRWSGMQLNSEFDASDSFAQFKERVELVFKRMEEREREREQGVSSRDDDLGASAAITYKYCLSGGKLLDEAGKTLEEYGVNHESVVWVERLVRNQSGKPAVDPGFTFLSSSSSSSSSYNLFNNG